MNSSPTAALNRTYALLKANGKHETVIEAGKLKLYDNNFYYSLFGELYSGIDNEKAIINFQIALSLSKTNTDRRAIKMKMNGLRH